MLTKSETVGIIQAHYSHLCEVLHDFENTVVSTLNDLELAVERGEEAIIRINEEVFHYERMIRLCVEMHYGVPKFIHDVIEKPHEAHAGTIKSFFTGMYNFFAEFNVQHQSPPEPILAWLNDEC
jgi:hypothetical protein